MAVRVTAAHTAEARAEAGHEAGEGGVAAAAAAEAALSSGGFLGLPAPFSEEGNEAAGAWRGPVAGGSAGTARCRLAICKPSQLSRASLRATPSLPGPDAGVHRAPISPAPWSRPNKRRSHLFSDPQP